MESIHILHVEDEPDDLFLVKRAFRQAGPQWVIHSVRDGDLAMDYLSGVGEYADRAKYPLPHLVLLDLRLPSFHGLDLLAWARTEEQFRHLPMVVLSGSAEQKDRARALELGASAFLEKTPLYANVVAFVANILSPLLASHQSGANTGEIELANSPGSATPHSRSSPQYLRA